MLGSVTLPPARNAPRRNDARQQSFSSTARLMWCATVRERSAPKAANTVSMAARSVMVSTWRPPVFSSAGRAKCAPNARRNSFGSRSAKASHAVTMRISRVVNVWQYSSTP